MKPLATLAKGICLFCAIFAAQAMAFADVAERTAPLPPAEVLIINSFHSGHFWEYNIIKRISEELENTETGFRIRLHCEYLDYERHPPGSLDNELVSLFAPKYAGVSLKAIIVTDNDALDFMLAHGNRLFPGVPVVFCGIADPPAELAERRAQYTGILENFSIHRILESIPLVHTEARHLAIICGDTTSARTALRQAAPELAAMDPGITVRTLSALPAQAMRKALEELPRDTVLLNFGYYRTADGQSYSMKESLQRLRSWTDLPMYSPWSGQLGKGVLAGQCEFNEFHAVHAARMVLSILGGSCLTSAFHSGISIASICFRISSGMFSLCRGVGLCSMRRFIFALLRFDGSSSVKSQSITIIFSIPILQTTASVAANISESVQLIMSLSLISSYHYTASATFRHSISRRHMSNR